MTDWAARIKGLPQMAAIWRREAFANPLFRRVALGAFVIALVDQATKLWIVHIVRLPERLVPCAKYPESLCRQIPLSPIFDLTYVENRGASFGMFAGDMGSRIFLSLVSLAIAIGLTVWAGRLTKPLPAAAAAFIIGGAIGNLYDRIAYGFVVDFLDFSGLSFPWVFNIADAAINVGVGLFILDAVLEGRAAKKAP